MGKQYTYIDLFAGCGGLSLGFHNSGYWKGLFAIEKSPYAFETLRYNLVEQKPHFHWPHWLPVEAQEIDHVIEAYDAQLRSLQGQVDLVAGGPPCQGFSTAGKRKEDDARNGLIDSYIRFIKLVQPKLIFFENVKGFTQQFAQNKVLGRVYSSYVQQKLCRGHNGFPGYKVFGKLVDFSEYGVPQRRTRFILVGIRKDLMTEAKPEHFFNMLQTQRADFLKRRGLNASPTLEEAISDLLASHGHVPSPDSKGFKAGVYASADNGYQQYLREGFTGAVPDSHRFANHRPHIAARFKDLLERAPKNRTLPRELKEELNLKKHTLIPLAGNTPSATITTLPDDYLHYKEPRIFTVREYARIQSFHDWYAIKGKYTTGGPDRVKEVPRYSQIGNAIPPLFGEQAGSVLQKMICS